jgi:hypothetical protein
MKLFVPAVLLSVCVGSSALAATWTTPPLAKNSTDFYACRVANNKSSDIEVVIEIRNSSGTVLATDTQMILAGDTASTNYSGTTSIGYCVVSGSLSKAKTPVTFCVVLPGSLRCEVAVTVP